MKGGKKMKNKEDKMGKRKKEKIKHIECKHKKELKEGGYHYNIGYDQELWLCKYCNMNLAGEIMKQLAIEVFVK